MNLCEVSPKAIIVVEQLEHFLKTERDCNKFISEFEARQLWKVKGNSLEIMKLAAEIGAYHYPQKSLDELQQMDTKQALEHLFTEETINWGKLERFKQSNASITNLFLIKQQRPKVKLMGALLYA